MITITSIAILTGFALFEVLAYRAGADSRPGFDERPERGSHRNI
jgi:hypothetical protein